MIKNVGIVLVIIVILLIVWGVYASMGEKEDAMMESESMMADDGTLDESMMDDDMIEGTGAMMQKGSYESYSADKLALADKGDVVLFFRASWCPNCRALDADIKANANSIPSDLTILDVDYDNSTTLKQKYGVTYQHTLVQVDSSGNQIAKWMGSPTLAALVPNIK